MKEVKTITWSSKQLAAMFGKENIRFDSYVQRNKCWDNNRKSLLVRTILNGFPRIPEIYATRDSESKVYQCLDGQQRLTTVFDFINDKIVLDELDPIVDDDDNVYELSGKKFSDLDEVLQDIILTYSWRVAYYDDLDDDDVAELFFLTNNSKPLTSVEHNRVLSKSLKTIQQIGQHELFTTALTQKAFEKYTHEDLVIKSYIMLNHEEPCLDAKVVKPTMINAVFTNDNVNELNACYDRILTAYKAILEDDKLDEKTRKRITKRLLTRTHMLSILPLVKKTIEEEIPVETFTDWVKSFFNGTKKATKYEKYNNRATSGSGHAENVRIRIDIIDKDFEDFSNTYVTKDAVAEAMSKVDEAAEKKNETEVETESEVEVEVEVEDTVTENESVANTEEVTETEDN